MNNALYQLNPCHIAVFSWEGFLHIAHNISRLCIFVCVFRPWFSMWDKYSFSFSKKG